MIYLHTYMLWLSLACCVCVSGLVVLGEPSHVNGKAELLLDHCSRFVGLLYCGDKKRKRLQDQAFWRFPGRCWQACQIGGAASTWLDGGEATDWSVASSQSGPKAALTACWAEHTSVIDYSCLQLPPLQPLGQAERSDRDGWGWMSLFSTSISSWVLWHKHTLDIA